MGVGNPPPTKPQEMKKKRKRIYYQKGVSYFEPPKDISEKRNDNSDPAKPQKKENELEDVYSTRVQEPEKSEPQELTQNKII